VVGVLLAGVCGALLAGCGDDVSNLETGGSPDEGGVTTSVVAPSTTVPTSTTGVGEAEPASAECRVSAEPTGPIFDADYESRFGELQPGPAQFDWNGDGAVDALRFEASTESVVVDHGAGTFVATGVPSDFSDVLYEIPGVEVEEAGPEGPPSAAAFSEGRAGPTPAAVEDFTGDGRPDLAVFRDGDLVVHASSGSDAAAAASRDFAAPLEADTSWSNPRTDTDLPFDDATVVAVGDINGDGVGDLRVDSYAPRSSVSPAFYLGKPCEP
jgi:hypothetical protein